MDLQLFIANSREELLNGHTIKDTYPLEHFDANRMWLGYYESNPESKEVFDAFVVRWENEWYAQLRPQAGIVPWETNELQEDFIHHFPDTAVKKRLKEQCTHGYATVWTIGETLENIAFGIIRQDPINAMFLDVACSLYLGVIRRALQSYVTEKYCKPQGLMILAEHSPEICYASIENRELDKRLVHVVQPWMAAKKGERPDMSMSSTGVMKPVKTQCNMLLAGQKQDGKLIHLNTIPCSNCARERCLYSQFGGCHLPREYQPWLDQHR